MTWTPVGIDGVFFISIATLLTSFFGVAVRYCLKSKCEHFSICYGLIVVDRRVDLETQEEIRELELGVNTEQPQQQQQNQISNHTERRPSLTITDRV